MAGRKVKSGNLTVEVIGADTLLRKLRQLEDAVAGDALEQAVKAGAEPIRADASQRAPRRTGKLAGSIIVEPDEKGKTQASVKIGPEKDAFYGLFHEFGTSKMAANPFLRPAMDEQKDAAVAAVRRELQKALARVAR